MKNIFIILFAVGASLASYRSDAQYVDSLWMIQQNEKKAMAEASLEQIKTLLLKESNIDSIVDKVVASSNLLAQTEAKIIQSEEQVKMEGKSWMRSLTVGVNLLGYNVNQIQGTDATSIQMSALSNANLTLFINPYEIFSRKNRIKFANQEVEKQRQVYFNQRREIKIYITRKFIEYQAALESYILSENDLLIADEAKHLSDELFKQGRISNQEYNMALGAVNKRKQELLKAESLATRLKMEIEYFIAEEDGTL